MDTSPINFQLWFGHGFVYYGIGLNVGNIGGDLFVNYFIFGLVDIPAFILTVVVLHFFPRKVLLLSPFAA